VFLKFMARGRAMLECAQENDLEAFQKIFNESKDMHNIMFWHVQKAFKEAVKYRSLKIISHIVEDLDIDLKHDSFQGFFHIFLFSCQKAEREKDNDEIEINRQVIRYLALATGPEGIDSMNNSGETVLHIACEILTDPTIVRTIMETKADLNPVRNDDKLPLTIIKARIEEGNDSFELAEIEEMLEMKGAQVSWRH